MKRQSLQFALVLSLAVPLLAPTGLHAQGVRDTTLFSDLRADGNGVAALRAHITLGFTNRSAENILTVIATVAGLNVTVDPTLPGLSKPIDVRAHDRTVAEALIEVARVSNLRALVSTRGEIVFAAAPRVVVARPPVARDSSTHASVELPRYRIEAARTERLDFENSSYASTYSVSGAALRTVPTFVEPDVLRSLQLMPGVAARSDWAAGFNVRGGEADQTLVLLDGYPIYNPFHLGGVFSTFIDATVGQVDLHTGALPARYGGRLSGVLDVKSASPTTSETRGTADLSLVSTQASLGRTFADGEGSWMVGARRSYADVVVDLIRPNAFPYHFQDFNAHLTRRFANGVRLAATGYAGLDVGRPSGFNAPSAGWGNQVLGVTASKALSTAPSLFGVSLGDSASLEQRLSVSRFYARLDADDILSHVRNSVSDTRVSGSVTAYRSTATTTVGYELAAQRLIYQAAANDQEFGDLLPIDSLSQHSLSASLFADRVWRPNAAWLIDLGARAEAVQNATGTGFSPRLSLKYFVNPNLALTAGAGRYTQWLHSLGREEEPVEPLQFWVMSDSARRASSVRDAVLGVEKWVTASKLFHASLFYKRYDDLLVANAYSDPRTPNDAFIATRGSTYGADVLLRQIEGADFSGWVSYSYAASTRVDASGVRYAPPQDRRHNLNLVGSWTGNAYTLGAHINVASGFPSTRVLGSFSRDRYDPTTHKWVLDPLDIQNITGAAYADRLPFYERVDVSLTHTGRAFGATVAPYLSIVNLFNSSNPAAWLYTFDGKATRASFPNIPFAPTLGVHIAF
ncbi:MAG: TonB-dependent receptor plug domain-containing protein [bacterium]